MSDRGPVTVTPREQRPHWLAREAEQFERDRRRLHRLRLATWTAAIAVGAAPWVGLWWYLS